MRQEIESSAGTIVMDVDGTLCDIKHPDQSYAEVQPRELIIARLREYKRSGYWIVLFTSRNMRTYANSIGLINKHTAPILLEWLDKWDVPYDEILFGKPWTQKLGFYVDDRAIRPDEFLTLSEQQIHRLLAKDTP